jgi:hypothetical protein
MHTQTTQHIDVTGIGIDIAADSIAQEQHESRTTQQEAALALLADGLEAWGWPAGLTSEQVDAVREAARSHLVSIAGWVRGGARLMRYSDATTIRAATAEELEASIDAARRDGGAGVIIVDGIRCYVEE